MNLCNALTKLGSNLRFLSPLLYVVAFSSIGVSGEKLEEFDFEFFGAEVFPWANGQKTGPVLAEKGRMALALQRELEHVQDNLDFAIYGVSTQPWLLEAVDLLVVNGTRVRGVVDQTGGQLGVWNPDDFVYRDTVRLAPIMLQNHLLPDIGPTGKPRSNSIMHNKFFVFDGEGLWHGSTNLSHTGIGAEYNANNSVHIRSRRLAQIFANEFSQMFEDRQFSIYKTPRSSRDPIE